VPSAQRLGVLNPTELRIAVEKDSFDTGEPVVAGFRAVQLNVEKLNAERKGDLH